MKRIQSPLPFFLLLPAEGLGSFPAQEGAGGLSQAEAFRLATEAAREPLNMELRSLHLTAGILAALVILVLILLAVLMRRGKKQRQRLLALEAQSDRQQGELRWLSDQVSANQAHLARLHQAVQETRSTLETHAGQARPRGGRPPAGPPAANAQVGQVTEAVNRLLSEGKPGREFHRHLAREFPGMDIKRLQEKGEVLDGSKPYCFSHNAYMGDYVGLSQENRIWVFPNSNLLGKGSIPKRAFRGLEAEDRQRITRVTAPACALWQEERKQWVLEKQGAVSAD